MTTSSAHAFWKENPDITLAAAEDDPRIQSVYEAVHFWNSNLRELDISLQFGKIHLIPLPDLDAQLRIMSAKEALGGDEPLPYPSFMDDLETEIFIVLTNDEMISFAEYWEEKDKALIAVKSDRTPPLSLPNVTRNVIAHELGHILGLEHNDDENMLMCGRPSSCRPDKFASPRRYFLKLTGQEKKLLRDRYKTGSWAGVQGKKKAQECLRNRGYPKPLHHPVDFRWQLSAGFSQYPAWEVRRKVCCIPG